MIIDLTYKTQAHLVKLPPIKDDHVSLNGLWSTVGEGFITEIWPSKGQIEMR